MQKKNENDLIKNNVKTETLNEQIESLLDTKQNLNKVTLTESKNEVTDSENNSIQLPEPSKSQH